MSEITHPTHDQHKHTNRLIHETSPYLLQHAHNPVDWYPWGEEALQRAKAEDKPILLSIGYSACHWCHVMERESFENEEIASVMNKYFVCIKVDREERPDIDGIYMQAVQAMTRQGGWPMTMFLTPDGRPFYGGTYFPPNDRHYGSQVMPGFPRILLSVASAYNNHRDEIEEQATNLADYLKQRSSTPLHSHANLASAPLLLNMFNTASKNLSEDFDSVHGGFGTAPKFPNSMALELLLRIHQHREAQEITEDLAPDLFTEIHVVETTLQKMALGGIYDQLGGGFHRYSVDAEWLAPHFEKMLYDNALLSRVYLHTYLVTGNPFYRRIVEETLDYVVREMTSSEGGFYSTQDADSEGEEGKFFLWTPQEITESLSSTDAALFMSYYDVTPRGNFEGKNILRILHPNEERHNALTNARQTLFAKREQRIKPGRDEKILTAWNGLMLKSFAEAARYLQRPDYLEVARANADFILTNLRHGDRLLRTYKDKRAHLNAYLEDYTFFADGLLSLYEASFETRWFIAARTLIDQAITLFADDTNGGFFDTGTDHEELVTRPKDILDNATPAGNSVAIDVLLRLAALTGVTTYRQRADDYLQPLAEAMVQQPQAFGHALGALDFTLSPSKEIAIIGNITNSDTQALLQTINTRYLPNSVIALSSPDQLPETSQHIPLLADRPLKDGNATAYICQNFACQAPVTTPASLNTLL